MLRTWDGPALQFNVRLTRTLVRIQLSFLSLPLVAPFTRADTVCLQARPPFSEEIWPCRHRRIPGMAEHIPMSFMLKTADSIVITMPPTTTPSTRINTGSINETRRERLLQLAVIAGGRAGSHAMGRPDSSPTASRRLNRVGNSQCGPQAPGPDRCRLAPSPPLPSPLLQHLVRQHARVIASP